MKALEWKTVEERQIEVANRLKEARKAQKISRERLSVLSGVSKASIRRFETIGEISFHSLVSIAVALDYQGDIDNLFSDPRYTNIEDMIAND